MNPELKRYIEAEILPRYDHFDKAHQRDHAEMVIRQSLEILDRLRRRVSGAEKGWGGTSLPLMGESEGASNMVYCIAAYHDTGLVEGRDLHHVASARIIREDERLRQWFTEEQISVMADAAEDHRASAKQPPRTVYGRIVAEADRFIDPEDIVRRTIQFGLDHYPDLSRREHYERMCQHLREKYGRGGYLRLWFDDSPNAARLESLRQLIDDEAELQRLFDEYFPN